MITGPAGHVIYVINNLTFAEPFDQTDCPQ